MQTLFSNAICLGSEFLPYMMPGTNPFFNSDLVDPLSFDLAITLMLSIFLEFLY